MKDTGKLKIAIIGSGNIGHDLLLKVMRSERLNCTLFAGRNLNSAGMKRANALGVTISDRGIKSIVKDPAVRHLNIDCSLTQAQVGTWATQR